MSSSSSAPSSTSSWIPPEELSLEGRRTGLHLYNSLCHDSKNEDVKVEFVPKKGLQVGWYICGPTVYDASHLGHARNYISFDIIRRVMEEYFGYSVFYVMNVTDIDDKIINRSWQNRFAALQAELSSAAPSAEGERAAAIAAAQELFDQFQAKSKEVKVTPQLHFETHEQLRAVLPADLFGQWTIQEAYLQLASRYEVEFFEDMDRLGMRRPSVITRVSEYVPEIIRFIETIIEKGTGYAAEGNVYFDTATFVERGNKYAKTSRHQTSDLLLEGEGSAVATEGKKRDKDFALWKASKLGEPVWDSPWGPGRPGWHIECSAMASDLLGDSMDLNCGGTDLRFPHHDNQLAQSEAHFGCKQWVNYFLHTGHLHINGRKMSKSLKNFITIRQALKLYTPRQLRLLFLITHWHSEMEIELVGSNVPSIDPPQPGQPEESEAGRLRLFEASIRHSSGTAVSVLDQVITFVHPQTGELEIPSATIFSSSSSSSSSSSTSSSSSSSTSSSSLFLRYLIDGASEERTWPLGENGQLLETIHLVPGRIVQLEDVIAIERIFADFFLNVGVVLRKAEVEGRPATQKWSAEDRSLHQQLKQTEQAIHAALSDSIDTPTAIQQLQALIDATNKLLSNASAAPLTATVLLDVSLYVQKVLRALGLLPEEGLDDGPSVGFRWPVDLPKNTRGPLARSLDTISQFRERLRELARTKGSPAAIAALCDQTVVPAVEESVASKLAAELGAFVGRVRTIADQPQKLLQACDQLRDEIVVRYGVRLEDLPDKTSQWKLDDPLALKRESHARSVAAFLRESQAAAKLKAQREKEQLANQKLSILPALFFKEAPEHQGKFAQFDDNGIPTHSADGKALSHSARKKVEKLFQTHTKQHQAWLAKQK